ncbi:tRNA (adenosine(37)-N6)-threonylcarbamoyltransferase complex dimerization subunit type 1 TsaB [Bacteroidia bacterium]|nr:tRNA (adenosine(37)-N6)-threonylcarbamoyltransferase complex dimerization subunit type 1 TsaB [Bacteroidia bacterium]
MSILLLETSTNICSVALSCNGEIIAIKESEEKNVHSKFFTIFIKQLLEENSISLNSIDAIAVSKGPGSYTGLRIGVSTAKGLCYAANKPLIAISSLEALAYKAATIYDENSIFCPMIDARRMEVYAGIWEKCSEKSKNSDESRNDETYNDSKTSNTSINSNKNIQHFIKNIREVQADIVDTTTYSKYIEEKKIVLLGDGAEKFKDLFSNDNRYLIDTSIKISATNMLPLAEISFNNNTFEDIAYFEPFYLKDFIAGAPKVKGLYI